MVLPTVLGFVIGLITSLGNFIGTVFTAIAAIYNATLKPALQSGDLGAGLVSPVLESPTAL